MFTSSLYSTEYNRLRGWLKAQREKAGFTQRALAKKLGVYHSIVAKIENGDRKLDVLEYVHYCEALGISPEKGITHLKSI